MTVERRAFEHLGRMSDLIGVFEHADHASPRREHGYCVDDMARLVVVAVRAPQPRGELVAHLEALALDFVHGAQRPSGETRNRRSRWGRWETRRSTEDCWGRSLWALGAAAQGSDDPASRQSALAAFERGASHRPPWRRTMAFAALGASEILRAFPANIAARRLLADAAGTVGRRDLAARWEWPEPRLTYANAVIPDALIAAGHHLDDERLTRHGLGLLEWLVDHETRSGSFSPTPVGGAGPDDRGPRFDQQPIEVSSLADACARAFAATGDGRWADDVQRAAEWFSGSNDVGSVMWDPASGGGYDGLRVDGPNLNQGAESTLALISTIQQSLALVPVPS